MKKIFSLFAALLFVGSMWATDPDPVVCTFPKSGSITDNKITVNSVEWSIDATVGAGEPTMVLTEVTYSSTKKSAIKFGSSKKIYYSGIVLSTDYFSSYNVTSVAVHYALNGGASTTLTTKQGTTTIGSDTYSTGQTWNTSTMNTNKGSGGTLEISISTTQSISIHSITITYEAGSPEPEVGTITPDPTSVSVSSDAVADGSITIAYDGITDMDNVDDVALFNDEAHTVAFSGDWLTAAWHDENKTAIDYTIAENTGAARTAYIYLFAIDDDTNDVEQVIEVTQAAAPVDPTIAFRDSTLDIGYKLDLSKLFTSNSEGEVTYSITSGSEYASLSGKVLTGVAVGAVTIQASQAAATGYKAKAVTNTITVQEHVVKAGTYEINPLNNAFWGCEVINKSNATEDEINFTGTQDDITVTIKNGSKVNAYINAAQTRVYSDGYTMKFEAPTGFSLTAISFTADGNNWAGTHTADVGTMTDSKNWAGTAESVTITFGGTCRIVSVSVTYIVTPSVANPSISGETPFLNSSTITLECETEDATIYYTLDGEDPDDKATKYTAPFDITETTTVKAIAYKNAAHSDILSKTFTKGSAITVAEALALPDKTNDVFVAGIVSEIKDAYTSESGYASYYISDNGLTTSQLQCYKGIGEGIDVLAVGDKVVVKGDYTTSYGKELKANNTIKVRTALSSVAIDDSEAAKAYEAGDEFELDKVKAIATFADATTLDVTASATWTPISAPTISTNGNVDVTATWCGKVGEKSIAVTVLTHEVIFNATPANGKIIVKANGTPIETGDHLVKGDVITVETTPASGYQLATLTANGENIKDTKTFTVDTEDVEIVASFSPATALDNTEASEKVVKTMENGVLIIRRGDKTYNGQGQLLK